MSTGMPAGIWLNKFVADHGRADLESLNRARQEIRKLTEENQQLSDALRDRTSDSTDVRCTLVAAGVPVPESANPNPATEG